MATTTMNCMNSTQARNETVPQGLLAGLSRRIALWRRRAREREELMNMSLLELSDMGVSVAEAEFEASKPFWRA